MAEFDPWADCYYARLAVPHDADRDEIRKKASVAKSRFKPSRSDLEGDRADEAWYNIQDAYETLTEPDERSGYDRRNDCSGCGGESDGSGATGSLHLAAASRSVTAGETVRFSVANDDGNPVEGATVEASTGERTTTDDTGTATLSLSSDGRVTVRTTHDDYESDSVTLTVEEATSETVRLSVSARTRRPSVDEPVEFVVENDDGKPVRGARLEATTGERTETGRDGTGTLTFDRPGEVTVRARKSGGDATYVTDDVDVTVEEKVVPLSLSADTTSPDRGEAVTFTVTGPDGEGVRAATVRGGGDRTTTAPDGTCRLSFDETGPVTVTASKGDTDVATFEDAELTVEVGRSRVRLTVDPEHGEVPVGEPLQVRVRGGGDRIEGATVTGESASATTGRAGTCELTFDEPGEVTIEATKEGGSTTYVPGTADVEVTAPSLSLSAINGTDGTVGTPMTFEVTAGGESISGATVRGGGQRGRTGMRGRCQLTFDEPGEFTVRAAKPDASHPPDELDVRISPPVYEYDVELEADAWAGYPGDEYEFVVRNVESGDPVAEATIEVPDLELTAERDGDTWQLSLPDDVTPGQYDLDVSARDEGGEELEPKSGQRITVRESRADSARDDDTRGDTTPEPEGPPSMVGQVLEVVLGDPSFDPGEGAPLLLHLSFLLLSAAVVATIVYGGLPATVGLALTSVLFLVSLFNYLEITGG